MIKVLDKPYLDLTTPIGRGFIAFLSAMAEDERHRIVKRANDGRAAARKRGGPNSTWTLEVIDSEGTSTVWDDPFDTAEAALAEFRRCIAEEGIISLTPVRN